MEKPMSNYPKLIFKMNGYLYNFFTYFETVIHPAAGKSDQRKSKRRSSKPANSVQTSPDSLNIRTTVRTQNPVRRNPAP